MQILAAREMRVLITQGETNMYAIRRSTGEVGILRDDCYRFESTKIAFTEKSMGWLNDEFELVGKLPRKPGTGERVYLGGVLQEVTGRMVNGESGAKKPFLHPTNGSAHAGGTFTCEAFGFGHWRWIVKRSKEKEGKGTITFPLVKDEKGVIRVNHPQSWGLGDHHIFDFTRNNPGYVIKSPIGQYTNVKCFLNDLKDSEPTDTVIITKEDCTCKHS